MTLGLLLSRGHVIWRDYSIFRLATTPKGPKTERGGSRRQLFRPFWGKLVRHNEQRGSAAAVDFQKSPSSDFIWRGTSCDFVALGQSLRGQKRLAQEVDL